MTYNFPPKFIDKVTTLIKSNLQNDSFGLKDLSTTFALSDSQIYRKIKKQTGLSTTQYIQEVRLKEAHRLIVDTDNLISDIAYQVGFCNASYFSKSFMAYYNYTPSSLRTTNSSKSKTI